MAKIDTQDGYLYSSSLIKTSNVLFWRIIELVELRIGKELEKISKSLFKKHARAIAGIKFPPIGGKDLYLVPNVTNIKIISDVYAEAYVALAFPMYGTPANVTWAIESICKEVGLKNVMIDERINLTVFLGGDYYPIRIPVKKGLRNGKGQPYYIAQLET
jgi:hypothetical protein